MVQPGDVARSGIRVTGLDDPAGRLQDAAGNALAFVPPARLLAASLWPADQIPPAVLQVTEPTPDNGFDLTLEFSEPLVLSGDAPSLALELDGVPLSSPWARRRSRPCWSSTSARSSAPRCRRTSSSAAG